MSQDDGDSLDDFEKEIEKECRDSKPSKTIKHKEESRSESAHENPITEEEKPKMDAIEEEKKKKL